MVERRAQCPAGPEQRPEPEPIDSMLIVITITEDYTDGPYAICESWEAAEREMNNLDAYGVSYDYEVSS